MNRFFSKAINQATKMVGSKARLTLLVGQLAFKLKNGNFKDTKFVDIRNRFSTLGRLVMAFAKGRYTNIPWKTLMLITAAILYFINPVDLIPDWIVGLGFTDDVGVLMLIHRSVQAELDKFIEWEKSQQTSLQF